MLLSAVVHAHSLRWTLPATVMLGSAPTFITLWGAVKSLTFPLPRRFYTYADNKLYSFYEHMVLFFFKMYTGVEVKLYGDVSCLTQNHENVILICNHQCTVDWVISMMLASAQGSVGHVRYILKHGLRYFPLYGFYLRQHSCIYVKKSGLFDQQKAKRQLRELKDKNIPVWLVIFPEGTRMNPELPNAIEKSQCFAREQGFEELTQVLTPKVRAFQVAVEQLKGHVSAVYDVTIAYSNTIDRKSGKRITAPGMPEFLTSRSTELHLDIERIPLMDVPVEEKSLQQWLFKRYQRKDRLMSHFYSSNPSEAGHFPGDSKSLEIASCNMVPPFLFFSTVLTVLLTTPEGRSLYWKVGVFSSIAGCIWMSFTS